MPLCSSATATQMRADLDHAGPRPSALGSLQAPRLRPRPLLALATLLLVGLTALSSTGVSAAPCAAPPPLDPAVPVRVAILVYCNTTVGVLPDNPIRVPACVDRTARGSVIKVYFQGQHAHTTT